MESDDSTDMLLFDCRSFEDESVDGG